MKWSLGIKKEQPSRATGLYAWVGAQGIQQFVGQVGDPSGAAIHERAVENNSFVYE
jgi:hypothetical protein